MQSKYTFVYLSILFLLTIKPRQVNLQFVDSSFNVTTSNTYREILDPSGNLTLEWTIDTIARIIVFQVDIREIGYIALALTRRGQLENSDVVVFGVDNGTPYIHDMYGRSNETIQQDESQDWRLIRILNSTDDRLLMRMERNLETCDEEDTAIKSELIHVIWDYGDNHTIPSRVQARGVRPIYFTDPRTLPVSSTATTEDANLWRLTRRYRIPPRHTSYWCSIHKMTPSLNRQHHIIGFDGFFENDISERHVHHQILYRCSLPPGINPASVFEPFVNHPGEECYINESPQLPTAFCREMVYIWAVGAEPVVLPEAIGLPIGDTANEYFMFESHYDNPEQRSDLEVVNGVDIQYSSELRPNEGSIIFVGHGVLGTFVMPPNTEEFNIVGHCSKACTSQMMASSVNVLGVALHAHTTTRKMRLKQYRGSVELPWILNDDDYDFQYQQIRFLQRPATILPGDHLTLQCTFDNTGRNGSATVSGFSTRDEMCIAFIVVDKKLPYLFCTSEYPTERTMTRYGIQNMTWELNSAERIVNAANNPTLGGLALSEVVEHNTELTAEDLEREQMFGNHKESCPNIRILGAGVYYLQQIEMASGGLIPIEQTLSSIAEVRPTTRTIETPLASPLPVNFPPEASIFVPPEECTVEPSTTIVSSSMPITEDGESDSTLENPTGASVSGSTDAPQTNSVQGSIIQRFASPDWLAMQGQQWNRAS